MANYKVGDRVIFRKDSGATTHTGTIKEIPFEGSPELYKIKAEDGSGEALVPERNIVSLAD